MKSYYVLFISILVVSAMRAELANGTRFAWASVPDEIVVERRVGEPVRFAISENVTTGYEWTYESNTNECEVVLEHRGARDNGTVKCGAGGEAEFTVTSRIYTPARVELRYRRPWEALEKAEKSVRLIVYTVGEAKDPLYKRTPVNLLLAEECARRGIELVDWHLHIRGGMTVEMAAVRERDFVVRSSAMENHGREWEIFDNARLRDFAERARKVNPAMPVGIQVNDRDWFKQIDEETRSRFDYILADTMIMGTLSSGRANRLWMVKEIPDADAWMSEYFEHVMAVLGEPISIYANATYLPTPIASEYDRLWTDVRMRAVIKKCVERNIAIEIQAESPFPRPKFLRLAKEMGAKFSFGTNNFDPGPKDLSRWLEAITWLDLHGNDIWKPVR